MAQFGSALALGARCRRFESCLPDSLKSQSRTDIFAASPGRLFYCSQTLLRKRCVKPREPQSVCVRRFWTSPDSWTPSGNDSATDSAQAFVTRLRTNVIHQINTCLLLRLNDQKSLFWRLIWAKRFDVGALKRLGSSTLTRHIGRLASTPIWRHSRGLTTARPGCEPPKKFLQAGCFIAPKTCRSSVDQCLGFPRRLRIYMVNCLGLLDKAPDLAGP